LNAVIGRRSSVAAITAVRINSGPVGAPRRDCGAGFAALRICRVRSIHRRRMVSIWSRSDRHRSSWTEPGRCDGESSMMAPGVRQQFGRWYGLIADSMG
jgi:hypothetical protein